jgi:transposase
MPKPLRVSPPDSASSIEVQAPRTKGRRQFSAAEKQRLVRAADACARGELGALLRKEGIYHSQLMDWRRQLAKSGSAGLVPKKTGPVPKYDAKDREIMALNSKVKKLERELGIVNGLVELQKKAQALIAAMREEDASCTR